jgi:hypothetical protein
MGEVSTAWRDDVGIAGHVLVARVCSRLGGGQRGTFCRCREVTSRPWEWQKIQSSTHLTRGPMPSALVVSAQTP